MRDLILTDIHANLEALETCLADAQSRGFDRTLVLGDLVGYGADPGFVVDTVKDFAVRGAIALLGNHDSAATGIAESMNDMAMAAIEWTRRQLSPDQHAFLSGLPLTAEDDDRLYVHASAASPASWDYVLDEQGRLRKHVNIYLDGKLISDRARLTDLARPEAEIYILQALSGG